MLLTYRKPTISNCMYYHSPICHTKTRITIKPCLSLSVSKDNIVFSWHVFVTVCWWSLVTIICSYDWYWSAHSHVGLTWLYVSYLITRWVCDNNCQYNNKCFLRSVCQVDTIALAVIVIYLNKKTEELNDTCNGNW